MTKVAGNLPNRRPAVLARIAVVFIVASILAVGFIGGYVAGATRVDTVDLRQVRAETAYHVDGEWRNAAADLARAIGEGCRVYEDLSYTCPDGTSGSALTDLVKGDGR